MERGLRVEGGQVVGEVSVGLVRVVAGWEEPKPGLGPVARVSVLPVEPSPRIRSELLVTT